MNYGFEPIPAIAGGTIRRSRFIKLSSAADNTVLEADANEPVIGIAHEGPKAAPVDGASDEIIAVAGDPITYYPEGSYAPLEIGTGGITRGAEIKADDDGKGVAAATTGATKQWVGAQAPASANEGEILNVLIKIYPHYPALS